MKTTKTGPTIEQLRVDLAKVTREREAYKKAKQENDDRFMRERDDARDELVRMTAERDELRAAIRRAHEKFYDPDNDRDGRECVVDALFAKVTP